MTPDERVLQDIATDPFVTAAERSRARKELRNIRSKRAARAERGRNKWRLFERRKAALPPMSADDYEDAIDRIKKELGI